MVRSPHPVRTCVGCRRRAAKTDLLRVVAEDQGEGLALVPDISARRPGRGCYLHPDADCLAQALRRRAFHRALRVSPGSGSGLADAALRQHVEQCTRAPEGADRDRFGRNWSNSS